MNRLLSIIIILCWGKIVYSSTFFCPFHFDDDAYIVNNLSIRDLHDLPQIWAFCPCRFVTFFTLALNYHFHQLNVFSYHLFNLAIHLGSAVLVWWLTLLTLSTPAMKENKITPHANTIALLAGLVFVSHPVQTEAVTFIWQRTASLAAFFYLASLCLYIKSRLTAIKSYYFCSLIMVVMAMFTKENTITLPLMILLYEFYFFETKENINWRYLAPFLLTIFIIPATMLFFKTDRFEEIQGVIHGPAGISPWHYLLTQTRVMITYIRLAFLPIHQNLDYDYPVFKNILEVPVLASLLCLAGILFCTQRLFLKYRLLSFSILWFFITLLPESSVLPLKDVIFEHRLYLPLAGYSIFFVSSLYYLFGKNDLKMMLMLLMVIIACNSILTFERNKVWRDDLALWDDAVQQSPHQARAYINRGVAYNKAGEPLKALADFNKAIEINPGLVEAYSDRGDIDNQLGHYPQAILDLNKALSIDPSYAQAYNNRGNAYDHQGKLALAIADYSKAIDLDPQYTAAYYNRSNVYHKLTQARSDQRFVH